MSVCLGGYCLGVQPNAGNTRAADGSYYLTMPADVVPYAILLVNHTSRRTNAYLSVDARSVGTFRLLPAQSLLLEHPSWSQQRFTFFAADSAPSATGIRSGDPTNGLISCRYLPELELRVMPEPKMMMLQRRAAAAEAMMMMRTSAVPAGREGGTALTGHSGQRLIQAGAIMEDQRGAVSITLRLLAPPRGDGITPLPGRGPQSTPYPKPVEPPIYYLY